jgi:GR25 family glycosyltransferase involved in LPS biosynthesis
MIDAKAFYINLDHRTDRRKEMEQELHAIGLDAIRWPATRNETFGFIGCFESHLKLWKHCLGIDSKYFIIFEDDFKFEVTKDAWSQLLEKLKTIDFDLINLGYNALRQGPFNDFLWLSLDVQTTSAYIVSKPFLPTLIRTLEPVFVRQSRTHNKQLSIDIAWKVLQPRSKWYHTKPRVGIQRPSYSDIEKQVVDYKV